MNIDAGQKYNITQNLPKEFLEPWIRDAMSRSRLTMNCHCMEVIKVFPHCHCRDLPPTALWMTSTHRHMYACMYMLYQK